MLLAFVAGYPLSVLFRAALRDDGAHEYSPCHRDGSRRGQANEIGPAQSAGGSRRPSDDRVSLRQLIRLLRHQDAGRSPK